MRALLLGNSQIICNCNLPQMVRRLSASSSDSRAKLDVHEVVIGGASIEKLWDDGRPRAAVEGGKWNWVLCHEIVYAYGGNGARLREYGLKFNEAAKDSGARVIFYASGDIEGKKDNHEPMYRDALALARECNGRVAGGGMAWLKAWPMRPELDFHCADRAHASELGYYLNACVIFSALTDCSPVGLDACDLKKDDAQFLQQIAWEQYQEDRRNEA
ncbi:MAG TPA: hypothetical protein VEJ63_00340 [Planctomycetota bacterium]|nr:hypothetical protein [Planctomycetota bacterium]